jgi:hypothetical protein
LADFSASLIPFFVTQGAIPIEVEALHGPRVVHDVFPHGSSRGFALGVVELAVTIGIELGESTSPTGTRFAGAGATGATFAASTTGASGSHGLHVLPDGLAFSLVELTVAVGIKLFHYFLPVGAGRFLAIGAAEGSNR